MSSTFDPETAENHPDIEKQWAVKAMHQAETYFKLISSMDTKRIKLTRMDDEIYNHFKSEFPHIDLAVLKVDQDFKSNAAKEAWRSFLSKYEKVADYNFGTLLRIRSDQEYTEENTFFVTRMQFYAIEISRNREGWFDQPTMGALTISRLAKRTVYSQLGMIYAAGEENLIPSPPSPTKKSKSNPRSLSIKNFVKSTGSLSFSSSEKKERNIQENNSKEDKTNSKPSLRKRGRLGSISASMSAGWEKMKEMTRSIINKTPVAAKLKKAASSYNLSNSSSNATSLEHASSSETLIDVSSKNIRTSFINKQKNGSIGLFKGSFLRDSTKSAKNSTTDLSKMALIGTKSNVKFPVNKVVQKEVVTKPKGRSMSLHNYSIKNSFSNSTLEIPTWPRQEINASKADKPTTATKNSIEVIQRTTDMRDLIDGRFPIRKEFYEKYKLKDLLGDGAFGFVFTAKDQLLGKSVAVKFITKKKVSMDNWVFMQGVPEKVPFEIKLLAYFHHPNIIRYVDHFIDEKYVILVTELHGTEWSPRNPLLNSIRNPGLKKLSANSDKEVSSMKGIPKRTSCDLFECIDTRFPDSTARFIFAQIAQAVCLLHENNIVHRDLKDENIVIDENYWIKIIDFGSASYIPSKKEHYFTKFNGTAHFASPEVAAGEPYRGPEAEIWALGVLLYTLTFGENPFQEKYDILKGKYSFPSPIHPDLKDLLRQMLYFEPEHRPTIHQVLNHKWLLPAVLKINAMRQFL